MSSAEYDLSELVAAALGAYEDGGEPGFEAFCARHPDAAPGLRERIRCLKEAGLFPPAGASEVPQRLGDYRLLRRLGDGGMGVVYLAEQESLGRQVAIKMVRPELLFFGQSRARFQREVEAIARLQHPGLVAVHAVGEENGLPYFAMECIRGLNLSQVLRSLADRGRARLEGSSSLDVLRAAGSEVGAEQRDPSDSSSTDTRSHALYAGTWVEWCLKVILQVAEAVQHAHEHGVLHRDIKPSNVMITGRGRVVLLDFGLAAAAGADDLTKEGAQLGSLPYMAPEQLGKQPAEVDARTDVYGLGVTLYELLYLKPAFPGEEVHSLRHRVLHGEQQKPDRSGVPWEAAVVCGKAMDPDPQRRYATAQALADDLLRILEKRPIRGRPPSPLLRMRRFAQRRPALVVSLAVLLIAVWGVTTALRVKEARARTEAARQRKDELASIRALDARLKTLPARIADPLRKQGLKRIQELWSASPEPDRELFDLGRIYGELLADSGASKAAEDVLERVRLACVGYLASNPNDLDLRFTLAQVMRQQAVIDRRRGALVEADQRLVAALALLRAHPGDLVADAPDRWVLEMLMEGRANLARLRADQPLVLQITEALSAQMAARRRHAAEAGLSLDPFTDQFNRAIEARTWLARGDLDRALAAYRESLVLLRDLFEVEPDNLVVGLGLSERYSTVAMIYRDRRDWEQLEVWSRRAVAVSLKVLETHRVRPWLVVIHNQNRNLLATALLFRKQFEPAMKVAGEALRSALEMVDKHPDDLDQLRILAQIDDTCGRIATMQRRFDVAARHFERLVLQRRRVVTVLAARNAQPQGQEGQAAQPDQVYQLALGLRKLALTYKLQRRYPEMVRPSEEALTLLRGLQPRPSSKRFTAAISQAILLLAETRLLGKEKRERGYYLLEETLESGELDPRILRGTRLYQRLNKTPLFRDLFARFE